jgi:tRNA pseudouridine65 synthase
MEIIYRDEQLIAINKPSWMLVHATSIAEEDGSVPAVQQLRNAIGQWVYPVHRIDRQTSGVLLFALNPEADKVMKAQFQNQLVQKNYIALVRGFTEEQFSINYPLANDKGKVQDAVSDFKLLAKATLAIPVGRYTNTRYSLLTIKPETGRMHQIRRHLSHYRHPIIGDKKYGDNKHNTMFRQNFMLNRLMLHAAELNFVHPYSKMNITIKANLPADFASSIETIFGKIPEF